MYFDTLSHAQPSNTPKYRRVKWCIYTVLTLLICTSLYYGINHFFDWEYSYAVFLLMLLPLYTLILGIFLSFKYTRYELNQSTLEISSGAYFMGRKIVPLDLMQSVKIEQGFVMKKFNLAVVTVYTRGDMVVLPYMTKDEAERVATRIIDRIKEIHYGHN
ncbi:PH domain-containing protein [Macrococcus animalis]|uniref:PH domain-containing protein n=1 Tax=Macrococcus animalis TaxID=3395467 RepID=UPI0039BDD11E